MSIGDEESYRKVVVVKPGRKRRHRPIEDYPKPNMNLAVRNAKKRRKNATIADEELFGNLLITKEFEEEIELSKRSDLDAKTKTFSERRQSKSEITAQPSRSKSKTGRFTTRTGRSIPPRT